MAHINVKKPHGLSVSKQGEIDAEYSKAKHILLKQIEYFEPDIIIGGNTLYNFFPDLNIPLNDVKQFGKDVGLGYYSTPERLYIDAYHPSRKGGAYADEIILTVKRWVNEFKKSQIL